MDVDVGFLLREIYSQVEAFPGSTEHFNLLKKSIDNVDSDSGDLIWVEIRDTLIDQIKQRLLHPGSSTSHILQVMVKAHRSLRIVDKRDNLFLSISSIFCDYLRERKDTVKCIIKALSNSSRDEEDDIFIEEFRALDKEEEMDPRVRAMALLSDDYDLDSLPDDDAEVQKIAFDEWEPEPIYLSVIEFDPLTKKKSSVLSMLVQIYGSKDMFVHEYQNILAKKLLPGRKPLPDLKKEIENLKLLCLKFDSEGLRNCEIMLNDFVVSRELARYVSQEQGFELFVLSKHFWPELEVTMFELPNFVSQNLQRFSRVFNGRNKKKKLEFLPNIGIVQLEFEFESDGIFKHLEVSCSPLQASLLFILQDSSIDVEVNEIASNLRIPVDDAQSEIDFWLTLGMLNSREDDGKVYYTIADKPGTFSDPNIHVQIEETVPQVEKATIDMSVYLSYVTGMLNNLGSLPLGRIHNMLKMFVQGDHSYTCSEEELEEYLNKLVEIGEIVYSDQLYSLGR